MTSVEVDTSVLQAMEFEIACEVVIAWSVISNRTDSDPCGKPSAYYATIHSYGRCYEIHKFMCEDCLYDKKWNDCPSCNITNRIIETVPIKGMKS